MSFFSRRSYKSKETGPVAYIIAGLGNPGREYEATRHNVGFLAVDALSERYHAPVKQLKFKSLCGRARIDGVDCLLLKPQTFMNKSGLAVGEAAAFYKVPPERVILIFDDVSLPPGQLRIRRKGSDGGHNGVKNIIYLTGSDQYPRVKIGVGGKPHPDYDLADWVLSGFRKDERDAVREAVGHAADAAALLVHDRLDEAMNRYNAQKSAGGSEKKPD